MPKVVLFIATASMGILPVSDGTVDWLFHDDDYGYTDFMNSLDTVVMGFKTWVQAKSFEDIPLPESRFSSFRTRSPIQPKLVFDLFEVNLQCHL